MDRNTEKIFRRLPVSIKERVDELPEIIRDDFEEIRIRVFSDTLIISGGREISLHDGRSVTPEVLDETLNRLLDYSYYAYEEELSKMCIRDREYTRANAFLRRNAAFARRYVPRKAPSYFTEGG